MPVYMQMVMNFNYEYPQLHSIVTTAQTTEKYRQCIKTSVVEFSAETSWQLVDQMSLIISSLSRIEPTGHLPLPSRAHNF